MPVAIDGTGSIAGLTTALSVAQGGTGAVTAGAALTTLGAPLNATTALTAAYTVVAADRGKLFDCSGTFTVTLTAAATLGAGFSFAVRNSGTGVITLDPDAAELVDGVATIPYAAAVSSLVTCNGTAFKTVGLIKTEGGTLVRGVTVATTSGTSIDFTGIPSWAKRLTLMFSGVSTNGTSMLFLQLGVGAVETAGYLSHGGAMQGTAVGATDFTAGFGVSNDWTATYIMSGLMSLVHMGGNVWVLSGSARGAANRLHFFAGEKTLAGTLGMVRVTTAGGVDLFDAGALNILYE